MSSAVEQIKSRLNVADVVGAYIKLEKAGLNLRARCPFHNEKTPSFYVSPERGTYHCFGCNKGGDLISFVEEIEGVDFIGALEILARRAGIELKDYDRGERDKNNRLYRLLDEASQLYEARLVDTPAALAYLKKRGLSAETIKTWRLGFVPDGWSFIFDGLKARGFSDGEMEQAGLVSKSAQGGQSRGRAVYDRFRNRLMFPLSDQGGRIVGFTGRIFDASTSKVVEAKYVNTPATTLYDKSSLLYGFDRAKTEIRRQDVAVLVEGQLDLILSHQAGVTNAVAVSGTALTEKHLTIIKRLTDNLIVAFDADSAGVKAARRALGLALGLGLEVLVAELPAGLDPADLILKDPTAWSAATKTAKPIIDFFLGIVTGRDLNDREKKQAVTKEVLPLVKLLTSPIDQAHYIAKIAGLIAVPEESVRAELARSKVEEIISPTGEIPPVTSPVVTTSRSQRLLRRLLGLLWWQEMQSTSSINSEELIRELETAVTKEVWAGLSAPLVSLKAGLILEAELAYDGMADLGPEVAELSGNLRIDILKEELEHLTALVRQVEKTDETGKLDRILRRCQEITTLINEIKN